MIYSYFESPHVKRIGIDAPDGLPAEGRLTGFPVRVFLEFRKPVFTANPLSGKAPRPDESDAFSK